MPREFVRQRDDLVACDDGIDASNAPRAVVLKFCASLLALPTVRLRRGRENGTHWLEVPALSLATELQAQPWLIRSLTQGRLVNREG